MFEKNTRFIVYEKMYHKNIYVYLLSTVKKAILQLVLVLILKLVYVFLSKCLNITLSKYNVEFSTESKDLARFLHKFIGVCYVNMKFYTLKYLVSLEVLSKIFNLPVFCDFF